MPQFTLLAVDEDGVCTTTKEFETVFLNDAVEYYSDFLRGVGYEFNELSVSASLGEVPEEEINKKNMFVKESIDEGKKIYLKNSLIPNFDKNFTSQFGSNVPKSYSFKISSSSSGNGNNENGEESADGESKSWNKQDGNVKLGYNV